MKGTYEAPGTGCGARDLQCFHQRYRGGTTADTAGSAAPTAAPAAPAAPASGTGRCRTKRAAGVCVNSAVSEQELHRARAAQRIHSELSWRIDHAYAAAP